MTMLLRLFLALQLAVAGLASAEARMSFDPSGTGKLELPRLQHGPASSGGPAFSALTLSAASYATDDLSGKVIGTISGKTTGSTLAISPADGKVLLAGSDSAGWKLVKGLLASTAGSPAYSVTESKAGSTDRSTSLGLTVASAGTYTPVVASTRLAIAQVYNSSGVSAETTAIAASSTNKTKPGATIASSGSVTVAIKLGEAAPNGALLNTINSAASANASYAFATSTDSTTGTDGTWTAVTAVSWLPTASGAVDGSRGAVQPFAALASGSWLRVVATNTNAIASTLQLGLYKIPSSGRLDLTVLFGMSISIQDSFARNAEATIRSLDSSRDPIFINLGVTGEKSTDYVTYQVPLLQTALAAGVPVPDVIVDVGPNDVAAQRPYSTASYGTTFGNNLEALRAAIVTAGVPEARQSWIDMDYVNWATTPLVNGIVNPENGSTPYNNAVVAPYIKGKSFAASWHPGWDAPAAQFSVLTAAHVEGIFLDNTTHPNGPWYLYANKRLLPIFRTQSGMPTGPPAVEDEVLQSVKAGVTTAYRKQRLLDVLGFLPSTTDTTAQAIRAQAVALVNGLSTTASAYADPASVTTYAGRSTAPALWVDPAYLQNVTKFATLSSRVGTITSRDASAYAIAPNSGGGIYYVEDQVNGRSVVRGNTGNVTGTVSGSDGAYNAGYLALPSGAATLVDSASQSFTIEVDYRDTGILDPLGSTTNAIYGINTFNLRAIAGQAPFWQLAAGQTIVGTSTVQLGRMHHYALRYDQPTHTWTALMDGVSQGTSTYTRTATTNALSALLGNVTVRAGGDLGDFVVTQSALSNTDLATGRTFAQAKWATP